jgi:CBS-domain-containing membrane protein
MSLEAQFDHSHTIDMSPVVDQKAKLQGIVLERFVTTKIKSTTFSILRVHGVSRRELKLAMEEGSGALFDHLKKSGVYPNTVTKRNSTL